MELTYEEQRQISDIIKRAEAREQRTITASKNGFIGWLRSTSLGYLVGKIIDLAWGAIRAIFGWF